MNNLLITSIAALVLQTSLFALVDEKSCTECHGENWSKKAIGISRDVSKMTHNDIAKALNGYKNNTYGGPLKHIMREKLKDYSKNELDIFSSKIGR